jgi:hypothetical protein
MRIQYLAAYAATERDFSQRIFVMPMTPRSLSTPLAIYAFWAVLAVVFVFLAVWLYTDGALWGQSALTNGS